MKVICLVGLPGSGKSTVGRQLARRVGLNFVDSDQEIEARLGCSISNYFESHGEQRFRAIELVVIKETATRSRIVLSTGGGAVLTSDVRTCLLQQNLQVVYLHSLPDEIFRRLRQDNTRPLLNVADPLARLNELYSQRDRLYRDVASLVVESGRPKVSCVVGLIISKLGLSVPG